MKEDIGAGLLGRCMCGKKWDWILGDRIESFASNKIQQEEKRPIKGTPM